MNQMMKQKSQNDCAIFRIRITVLYIESQNDCAIESKKYCLLKSYNYCSKESHNYCAIVSQNDCALELLFTSLDHNSFY